MNDPVFDLHGLWRRSIGGRTIDQVNVPGSYAPVGECTLEHNFDRPWAEGGQERCFLVTEGVLSSAEFSLNGVALGKAGPYCRYRFEIPSGTLREQNNVRAVVKDMAEPFGPTPGRRFDGGLFRDIWIERRPATFLEHFAFRYSLDAGFSVADCQVEVALNGPGPVPARLILAEKETGQIVAEAITVDGHTASFRVERPRIWSPQEANLYLLTVSLAGDHADTLTEVVGFRKIDTCGQDIFLNDRRLILKGVCRHEFTAAHGYTPPESEIRQELAAIQRAGFNYVRLVHSPQSPRVCRIAAELGLLVSEEPGTCFHDLSDHAVAAPALECLKRTVLRDRNVPSILAWYIYNECPPCTPYAVEAAAICRELDPDSRLSFADCSGQNDAIKDMVTKADLSWYGINLYDFQHRYPKVAAVFQDRPVLFTEWGGLIGQGNPRTLKSLCDMFVQHVQPGATPRLAGCAFWVWADYEERSRPEPAAYDGWTIEGLVDRQGEPHPDLDMLSRMCFEMDHPPTPRTPVVTVLSSAPRRNGNWRPLELSGVAGDQGALEAEVAAMRRPYGGQNPVFGKLNLAGIDFACRETPLLLGKGRPEIVIPVGHTVRRIAFLGHVALKGGYPCSAIWSVHHRDAEPIKQVGQDASQYAFQFEDGTVTQSLEHGVHILRANNICRWWLTNPRGSQTQPVVQAVIHPSFEILRLDLWEMELPVPRRLTAVHWRLKDEDTIQALYAVSVLIA